MADEPWNEETEYGERPGGMCCQRAAGEFCYEHDPANYPQSGKAEWKSAYVHPPANNGNGESDPVLCYHPQTGSISVLRATHTEEGVEWWADGKKLPDCVVFWMMWKTGIEPSENQIKKHLEMMTEVDKAEAKTSSIDFSERGRAFVAHMQELIRLHHLILLGKGESDDADDLRYQRSSTRDWERTRPGIV